MVEVSDKRGRVNDSLVFLADPSVLIDLTSEPGLKRALEKVQDAPLAHFAVSGHGGGLPGPILE